MIEKWKSLEFTEGKYEISNFGNMRIVRQDGRIITRIINQDTSNKGKYRLRYYMFTYKNKTYTIHKLVALNFVPNPDNKPEVNHIDFNTFNNRFDNLQWVTHSENMKHSKQRLSMATIGEKCYRALFTDEVALKIKQEYADGAKFIYLAKKYNTTPNTICQTVKRYYKHLDRHVVQHKLI